MDRLPIVVSVLGSSISTKLLMQQQVETKHFKCQTITLENLQGQARFRLFAERDRLYVSNLVTHELQPLLGSPRSSAMDALRRSFEREQATE